MDRGSYERRHIRRPICDFLRDSLGQRSDQPGQEVSALWRLPLGWFVEYGYMPDDKMWVRIYGPPDGKVYAHTDDGDVYWLEAVLP